MKVMPYAALWMLGELLGFSDIATGEVRPVVLELFTSEGCSSCPPAEVYTAEVAQRSDVLALTFPYRDGTTHVLFEPLDFLPRLSALVPSPGVNLTRYHGVFAPNHRLRAQI